LGRDSRVVVPGRIPVVRPSAGSRLFHTYQGVTVLVWSLCDGRTCEMYSLPRLRTPPEPSRRRPKPGRGPGAGDTGLANPEPTSERVQRRLDHPALVASGSRAVLPSARTMLRQPICDLASRAARPADRKARPPRQAVAACR